MAEVLVRPDLSGSHLRSFEHVARPGSWWTGRERVAIAALALTAYADPEPLVPWEPASRHAARLDPDGALPAAAVDAAYRLARHAATTNRDWYDQLVARGLDPRAYVELVGVVVATVPVAAFRRAVGLDPPVLPSPQPGDPDRSSPPLASARLNWVPVAAPPDRTAAVLQALSAVPAEEANRDQLHGAQYLTTEQMGDIDRGRGPLTRAQMEFVAARLSAERECFY